MKRDGSITAIIAVCLIGFVVVLFIGLKKKPKITETAAIANVMDIGTAASPADLQQPEYCPEVGTILVDQGRLVIGAGDGIYVKPGFNDEGTIRRESMPEIMHLNVILPMGDRRYAGGDGLVLLDENYSYPIDQFDFGRKIYALAEFGEGILIGSESGLWYHRDLPAEEDVPQDTLLKGDLIVTALAEDRGGLWVGTKGDGLYRFDGSKWQRRFLERDSSMFDFVGALEYSYPFLWVGTEQAIFRYDGGKWAQMFVADSSETYDVTCMMTTPAATYIGTTAGLLRFASDTLTIDFDFEGSEIAGLCRSEKGVIVATRNDGIFTYKGKEEIVSPEQLAPDRYEGDENETIAGTDPEVYTVPIWTEYAGDTDY